VRACTLARARAHVCVRADKARARARIIEPPGPARFQSSAINARHSAESRRFVLNKVAGVDTCFCMWRANEMIYRTRENV